MRSQRELARSGWRPGPESAKLDRSAVRAGCRLPWRRVRRPVPVSIINPAKASRAAVVGMPAVDTRASVESLGNLERRMTRSEEHTSEIQSLMRNSYAVFSLKKKKY